MSSFARFPFTPSPAPRHRSSAWLLGLAGLAALAGCGEKNAVRTAPIAAEKKLPVVEADPSWKPEKLTNLSRLEGLGDRHRELLASQGFFLAPQPDNKPAKETDGYRPLHKATHLFHVYERNDYIAFPSFVTVDLAIDATHAYFDAVMREVEERHLVPRLKQALTSLTAQAEQVRAAAKTPAARATARRAVIFWAVARHLLESPAAGDAADLEVMAEPAFIRESRDKEDATPPPAPAARKPIAATGAPAAVRADVEKTVAAIQRATGALPIEVVRGKIDLTQMRPRGHYTRNGVLQRYFRTMSWLGMASFPLAGDRADIPGLALLCRSWLGAADARSTMREVLAITTFFAGGPDAADIEAAAARLLKAMPSAATATADELLAAAPLAAFGRELTSLPAPRISLGAAGVEAGQVRVMGRRAFEDTVGMQQLVEALAEIVASSGREELLPQVMGALGSAAVLGSDLARDHALASIPPEAAKQLAEQITAARKLVAAAPAARWGQDAYHGTLHSLRALLDPPPEKAPTLLKTAGWRNRLLQAFAGGWAELRHDTILYGEQLGAECDAPTPAAPPGWVEPIPEAYRRLGAMVRELNKRLDGAGINREAPSPDPDNYYYQPLSRKAKILLDLLDFLTEVAEIELAGKSLTADQLEQITLIGGRVEWLLITLADTDLLSRRDQDMAVIADVFTWRTSGKVVEVGVAHPELIYAVIPGPQGPVIARGAVMSYREFLQPMDRRMTDEEWRQRLSNDPPDRPSWLDSIYAEPVPAIKLRGDGVSRCGPMSGASIEL